MTTTSGFRRAERRVFAAGILIAALLLCCSSFAQEYYDNVVIILDASGSMSSNMAGTQTQKMAAAKSALKEVLKSVPPTTRIGLLVFSSKNVKENWLYPLGPRDDAELMKKIDLPQPGGGTPLGQFIKIGADRLLEERTKQFGYGSYRLLIVTDGEATDGDLTQRYTPEIVARGVTVDVIGVDMKKDHALATQVHSYRRANDPEALKKALSEILAEVGGTKTDAANQEAFDMLAPIPVELGAAMVDALSKPDNSPIGTPKPKAPAPAAAPKQPKAPDPPKANNPAPQSKALSWKFLVVPVVVVAIWANGRRKRQGR